MQLKESLCPKCQSALPPNAPRGLCTKCLIAGLLEVGPLEAPPPSAPSEPDLPRTFGAYELLEEVGRGGMGVVYRAHQKQINRFVALKMLRDQQLATPRARQRFQIEAEAAARLDHPNIVPIYEFGTADGQPFISMKLVEGRSLGNQLRGTPMEPRSVARLMATLARAVHYAHQRGILHRDLKPANILLDGRDEPQVTDFGLAKRLDLDSGPTLSSDVIGSPNYMAPEQAAGRSDQVTTAADVYSLGAIMYELLTGRAPFRSDTPLETIRKVIEEEPIAPRLMYKFAEPDLETICLKCMQKEPAQRYSSAEALAEDLTRWLHQEPILARPPNLQERIVKWVRRNPRVAALTGLLLLALGAGLSGVLLMNVRLSASNRQKDLANLQLSSRLRDSDWLKVEDLAAAGKWSRALALLSHFLRTDPSDHCAASRVISMLNSGNFCLPAAPPLQHGAPLNSVSVSADGQWALTAADDGKARLWELESGTLRVALAHPLKVTSAEFTADKRLVLTACQDGSFRLWDVEEAKVVLDFPKAPNSKIPPALTRDLRHVALAETDHSVRVWDMMARRSIGGPFNMPNPINQAAFSSDSNILCVASEQATQVNLRVWTVNDGHPLTPLLKQSDGAPKIEFSPVGAILATAAGREITVWDTKTWAKLKEIKAHNAGILMIEFTPDGRRLVSAAYDEAPKIWDVTSGAMIGQPIAAEQPHCFFKISPDGKSLATRSRSGVVRLWDAISGLAISEPFEHEGPVTDLAFTPDGKMLLTASQDGTAQALSIQLPRPASAILKTDYRYANACFTPDGRRIIASSFKTALVFDAATSRQTGRPMTNEFGHIYRIRVSPDGGKLATAGYDGHAQIWNLATCQPVAQPVRHSMRIAGLAFSPDNRLLATASEDATARLWDAETGDPKSPPLRHDGQVLSVAFRSDSRLLLTAALDGTARLWQTEDGRPVWPEPIHHKGIVWTAEFDPPGRRIVSASADRSAVVWDAQSARALIPPIRHERGVSGARFSPDGRWVLTWSEDATARVWDAQSGKPVSQPMRHRDEVNEAVFSPDGTLVLTGSKDGVVRLWDAATGYPISEPLQYAGPINVVEFSPDGRRFLAYAEKDTLRTWDVMTPPVPVPAWFCDLIEAVAGKRLTTNRETEPVSSYSLQKLRQRFASAQDSDFYSRWARWFLWDRMKDPSSQVVP